MHTIAIITAACMPLLLGPDYSMTWWSLDGGGGTSSGGAYVLSGTVGQYDAGVMTGGQYTLVGGFWAGDASTCPADVNGDGDVNILDFVAFQNAFTNADPLADCNTDGNLNILDFVCYQTLFQKGCD